MRPRGFALMVVLWLIVAAGVLALAATLSAREAMRTAANRIALSRAGWRAEGCAEQMRALLDAAVAVRVPWERLGTSGTRQVPRDSGCSVVLRPNGYALDVNAAAGERLAKLLRSLGGPSLRADSLTQALLDWRDPDGLERQLGAELGWYRMRRRPGPSNRPLSSTRQLAWVRGFDQFPVPDSLLGVEPGPTPVNLAPLPVVASLPGVGAEIVERLRQRRASDDPVLHLPELAVGVSRAARDSFGARYAELVSEATVQPAAWILTVSASEGSPPVTSTIELRLEPAEARAAVVRKRVW